ncbi:MAG TPA: 5'-3' exonuclease H3TH domain-containing protein, partial [Solirubrobacteraceae bacterium]
AVVVCFGEEAAHYRTEAYAPYHADRPPVPDGLEGQFAAAAGWYGAFGWASETSPDLEADDLLGSLATLEESAGGEALLVTGDRDLFQCASAGTTVLYLKTGVKGYESVDPADVRRRYGIDPELVPDFIALRGDPSDGLPGAKGIGEKTAADLLRRHGSLETAIDQALREKPKVRGALHAQAAELHAFKDIATLRHVDLERPADRATDLAGGAAAARTRGMNRLAERLEKAGDLDHLRIT